MRSTVTRSTGAAAGAAGGTAEAPPHTAEPDALELDGLERHHALERRRLFDLHADAIDGEKRRRIAALEQHERFHPNVAPEGDAHDAAHPLRAHGEVRAQEAATRCHGDGLRHVRADRGEVEAVDGDAPAEGAGGGIKRRHRDRDGSAVHLRAHRDAPGRGARARGDPAPFDREVLEPPDGRRGGDLVAHHDRAARHGQPLHRDRRRGRGPVRIGGRNQRQEVGEVVGVGAQPGHADRGCGQRHPGHANIAREERRQRHACFQTLELEHGLGAIALRQPEAREGEPAGEDVQLDALEGDGAPGETAEAVDGDAPHDAREGHQEAGHGDQQHRDGDETDGAETRSAHRAPLYPWRTAPAAPMSSRALTHDRRRSRAR
jgi:hypothetical protein